MKISKKTIEQVKENRALIESKDWLKIWETLKNSELNGAFVELGYNPLIGLKEVPGGYFENCIQLTDIEIPSSVKSIGNDAFYECTSLTSVIIPNSVTSIEVGAFYYCSSLASVTIGNSVTSIGDYAFRYCSSLKSIVIPNSVTSLGRYAFSDCSKLTSIKYSGTKEQWSNIFKGEYWKEGVPATKVICIDGGVSLI